MVFVNFEGIDGSGKETQAKLLTQNLAERGIRVSYFEFPRYDSPEGVLIKKLLAGEFGDLSQYNPWVLVHVNIANQQATQEQIRSALVSGSVVLNRYWQSNIGHGSAKFPVSERKTFFAQLEKAASDLVQPDIIFLMDGSPENFALRMKQRNLLGRPADQHEKDALHQKAARECYFEYAKTKTNWVFIKNADTRTAEDIQQEVLAIVLKLARTAV